jgi:hypothetical protein
MSNNVNSINNSNLSRQSAVINQESPLFRLPLELIISILKSLSIKDVISCNLLCKKLNRILSLDEEEVCRNLFRCHFPHINLKENDSH